MLEDRDWEIKQGDVLDLLREMPDQCVVASPPYWGLRDYGVPGQLGLEATPEEYVARMVQVFREVRRVLRDDGVLFLNLGDSYWGSGGAHKEHHANPGLSRSSERGGVPREASYGTSGKELGGYQDHGYSSENPCDGCHGECRRISRNDSQRVPMQSALSSEPNRENTESEPGHFPTSDSFLPGVHSLTPISQEWTDALEMVRQELNPAYVEMSKRRIIADNPLINGYAQGVY